MTVCNNTVFYRCFLDVVQLPCGTGVDSGGYPIIEGVAHTPDDQVEIETPSGIRKSVARCDKCTAKDKKLYPQGWRNVPGDTCSHGTYVGDIRGVDSYFFNKRGFMKTPRICDRCEDPKAKPTEDFNPEFGLISL